MRKFGIELEVLAPIDQNGRAIPHLAGVVRSTGIACDAHGSHLSSSYARWAAKRDGSLQPQGRAAELVSPIMAGHASSYDEIRRVVEAVDAAGYKVNTSCGFHVHLNLSDLNRRQRQLVVLRLALLWPELQTMLPVSRRNNAYCNPISEGSIRSLIRSIETGGRFDSPGKYMVVNCDYLERGGDEARIEVRCAGGTTQATKVVQWVRFLQETVDEVVRKGAALLTSRPTILDVPVPAPAPQATRAPTMRRNSLMRHISERLVSHGDVTSTWATDTHGITPVHLRAIVNQLRGRGAVIVTVPGSMTLRYTTATAMPLRSLDDLFGVRPAAAPVAAPAAPAPMQVRETMTYGIEEGLSVDVIEWVRARRAVFAEDA